ncbi:MAG: lipid-binding SYLF domain-containing protein [Woeseiaceae bacterium]
MRMRLTLWILLGSLLASNQALAATQEEERIANATDVVAQLLQIPEQSVPPALLARAYAIAVIPNVVKIGFGLGARRGKGIVVVRQDNGSWSNPAFVTLTGGSFGWQIGAQSTDIILVFKTRKGVDDIADGKLTLGADASIAAGPVGRSAGIATDIDFQAEVFSYSRSRGLFAGVALEGAGISMDRDANAAFYGTEDITAEQIFASSGNAAPAVANNFVQILTDQTRQLPTQPSVDSEPSSFNTAAESDESSVRTYGIDDPDAPETSDDDNRQYENF